LQPQSLDCAVLKGFNIPRGYFLSQPQACGYNGYKGGKMSQREKLVIVGGSAGGPSAAARAKRINPKLEVTMFEQGRFISYGS